MYSSEAPHTHIGTYTVIELINTLLKYVRHSYVANVAFVVYIPI